MADHEGLGGRRRMGLIVAATLIWILVLFNPFDPYYWE
jgi:hypothetical protein